MFRLALSLGMTVAELSERMDSRELSEWMAYNNLEPFGEERADARSGIVAATIANVHRGKNTRPYEPKDFMPKFGPAKEQTPDEMKSMAKLITSMYEAKAATSK